MKLSENAQCRVSRKSVPFASYDEVCARRRCRVNHHAPAPTATTTNATISHGIQSLPESSPEDDELAAEPLSVVLDVDDDVDADVVTRVVEVASCGGDAVVSAGDVGVEVGSVLVGACVVGVGADRGTVTFGGGWLGVMLNVALV